MIVVTGGLVRLTGSGLGCPTWPRCTEDSFVTVPEMGWHGIIEFGNRLLTFVLILIALLTFIAVRRTAKRHRRGLTWPALLLGLGIIVQALVGGITVLTGLNSWFVGAHFIISGALISIASVFLWRVYSPVYRPNSYSPGLLAWPIFIVGWLTVFIGVVVTGAGPHAGDANTPRNGFDLEIWQHFHSWPAYLLLGLIALAIILIWLKNGRQIRGQLPFQILLILFIVATAQAILGIVQSRLGVPALLAGAHMLGAAVIISLLTLQLLALRSRYERDKP